MVTRCHAITMFSIMEKNKFLYQIFSKEIICKMFSFTVFNGHLNAQLKEALISQVPAVLVTDVLSIENLTRITFSQMKLEQQPVSNDGRLKNIKLPQFGAYLRVHLNADVLYRKDKNFCFHCTLLQLLPLPSSAFFTPSESTLQKASCVQMFISECVLLGIWPIAIGTRSTP